MGIPALLPLYKYNDRTNYLTGVNNILKFYFFFLDIIPSSMALSLALCTANYTVNVYIW